MAIFDEIETVLGKVDGEFWDGDPYETARKAKEWAETQAPPYLTRKLFTSGLVGPGARLVRWIGMVQDMASPEIYRSRTMFRDILGPLDDAEVEIDASSKGMFAERQKLFCVPVPGLSEWVSLDQTPLEEPDLKRGTSQKRARDEEDDEEVVPRQKVSEAMEHEIKNRELPKELECVVRWYPPDQTEDMPAKLNDIVEIIGVLGAEVGGGSPDSQDWDAATSVVARVHALSVRVLRDVVVAKNNEVDEILPKKQKAIDHLATALNGNLLVAEYVFLTLLSNPFKRIAPDRCLGAASLEILTPADCSKQLQEAVAALVPISALVKTSEVEKPPKRQIMGEEAKEDFFFGKDERLMKHPFQLAPSTVIILDHDSLFWESCKALVGEAKFLMYDFNYDEYTRVDVDHPTVVVTNNRRGIGADAAIALPDFAPDAKIDPFILPEIRNYIAKARDHQHLSYDDDVSDAVQKDYLAWRQANLIPPDLAEASLHYFMTLARLHAKSLLADSITLDHWHHCKNLEHQRLVQLHSLRRIAAM